MKDENATICASEGNTVGRRSCNQVGVRILMSICYDIHYPSHPKHFQTIFKKQKQFFKNILNQFQTTIFSKKHYKRIIYFSLFLYYIISLTYLSLFLRGTLPRSFFANMVLGDEENKFPSISLVLTSYYRM